MRKCSLLLTVLAVITACGCGGGAGGPSAAEQEAARKALSDIGANVSGAHPDGVKVNLQSNEKVTDGDLKHIKGLGNVVSLMMGETKLTDEGLAHLAEMDSLHVLQLPSATTDKGFAHVAKNKSLTRLVAKRCKLTDASADILGGFTSLRGVDLDGTEIGDKCAEALGKLTDLGNVNLTGTKITDASLKHFEKLEKLAELYMYDCQLSDEAVAALKKKLPETSIYTGPSPTVPEQM